MYLVRLQFAAVWVDLACATPRNKLRAAAKVLCGARSCEPQTWSQLSQEGSDHFLLVHEAGLRRLSAHLTLRRSLLARGPERCVWYI